MIVLRISVYHKDLFPAILRGDKLIADVEEERFVRLKNWEGFVVNSISYCLKGLK